MKVALSDPGGRRGALDVSIVELEQAVDVALVELALNPRACVRVGQIEGEDGIERVALRARSGARAAVGANAGRRRRRGAIVEIAERDATGDRVAELAHVAGPRSVLPCADHRLGEAPLRPERPPEPVGQEDAVAFEDGDDVWIGWAVEVPADWEPSSTKVTTFNIHGPGGTPPQIRVQIVDDQWRFTAKSELGAEDVAWPLELGAWHELVVHARFTKGDGVLSLWHRTRGDGDFTLRVHHEGPTAESTAEFPFHARFGLIRGGGPWQDSVSERTLLLDEIRIGDGASSFEEVAPGSGYTID